MRIATRNTQPKHCSLAFNCTRCGKRNNGLFWWGPEKYHGYHLLCWIKSLLFGRW